MRELVEVVVRSLVDHPERLTVTETQRGSAIVVEVVCDPEDTGKVIGRQGRVIKAIRVLARTLGLKAGRKVEVEVR
ncbi:MAG: KH domain-containing protein [Bacillota bacterium]